MIAKELKQIKKKYDQAIAEAYRQLKEINFKEEEPLEAYIRIIMLKRPWLHPYRNYALNTLFCIIGTGIKWNGNTFGDPSPTKESTQDDYLNSYLSLPPITANKHEDDLIIKKAQNNEVKNEIEASWALEIIETINNIDKRCKEYNFDSWEWEWYPLSAYSHIYAPKDVEKSLKKGIIETLNLISSQNPDKFREERSKNNIIKARQLLDQIESNKEI